MGALCSVLRSRSKAVAILLVFAFLWRRRRRNRLVKNVAAEVAAAARTSPLLLLSATALAARIRRREVTALELIEASIAQITSVNTKLNAVVFPMFDRARTQARLADARLAQCTDVSTLPPFHGVPIAIKEVFEMEGTPWTAGLMTRRGKLGTSTCPAVSRLEDAGFIPMGKDNISENCMWMESANKVYGWTNNPYDLDRTVGGSSGGTAAIVSACGAPCGLGSDVGGSIRIPAFFNGLYGHKPTGGAVPNTGTHPPCHDAVQRYCQLGPLVRHPEDLMPMLRIVAGPDAGDSECRDFEWGDPQMADVSSLTILNCMELHGSPIISARDGELRAAQLRVCDALRHQGCQIREVGLAEFPELKYAFDIWASMLGSAQPRPFRVLLSEGKKPLWVVWELLKWAVGRSDHTLPALGLALLEQVPEQMPAATARFVQLGLQLKERLAKELTGNTVLLYPSLPNPAPKHRHLLLGVTDAAATAIFNVMELPVTAVPLGLSSNGLPLGVQVVAAHGQDQLSIAVALELHKHFGGWHAPRPPVA